MAHLERKNDPLVKGGWKAVQVRHPESILFGEERWVASISDSPANALRFAGYSWSQTSDNAPSHMKQPRSDASSRFVQPRVGIALALRERAPEQLLRWYLCVFRRRSIGGIHHPLPVVGSYHPGRCRDALYPIASPIPLEVKPWEH